MPGRPRTREPRIPKSNAPAAPAQSVPEVQDADRRVVTEPAPEPIRQAPEAPSAPEEPRGRGRPSNYPALDHEMVLRFAQQGLTNEQIYGLLGIGKTAFYDYLKEYPEFANALKAGQSNGIEFAKRTLFQRATGYSHPEEKIFCHDGQIVRTQTIKHYAPDTTALIFYLINKAGGEYKDTRHIQASGGVDLNHKGTIPSALMEDLNKALLHMGEKPSAVTSAFPVSAETRRDVRRTAAPPTIAPAPPEPDPEDVEAKDPDAIEFTPQDYAVERPSMPLDLSALEDE